ncbi:hypothetical protein SAMN02983003_2032 [Devosia enhydra]|uniref:Uncharacterized protein n=1 Tax=Devosia enhydra TaxID=665118 RepID=A0A1K2HXL7_9HYPH|nr:hypothetical protein SAMN02983003_2032 [Devosia enhydra]
MMPETRRFLVMEIPERILLASKSRDDWTRPNHYARGRAI